MAKRYALAGKLALLAAALIWGGSFVGMKSLTEVLPTQYLIAVRFSLATVVMALALIPRLKKLNLSYLWRGGVIGLCLFGAYSFQTYGLMDTTPGKNAFLTAIYCVLVPFLYWAVDQKRPDGYNIVAAFMTVGGIGLVSLDSALTMGRGDALTLVGGVFFAVHMVAITKLGKDHDPLLITMLQFAGVSVCAWIGALCFEEMPTLAVFTPEAVGAMSYLVLCATCLTLSFQNFGQQHTPPAAAAILLSLESVFGVLISVIAGERPTVPMLCGFAVIFAAVLISETKLRFLPRKNA
ncbi:MAG: DMT family transporter [Clostridia bacterium]|nr:DMT family transporter [Clostridia bacterium]